MVSWTHWHGLSSPWVWGAPSALCPPPTVLSVPSCQKSFRVFRVFRGPTLRRLPSVLRRPVRFLRPLRLLAANPPPSVPSVPFCKNPSVYSVFSAMVRGPASGSGRFVSGEKDLSDRWHRRNTEVDPRRAIDPFCSVLNSVLTRLDSCKIFIRFMGTGVRPRSIRGSHPSSPSASVSELRGLCDTIRLLRLLRLFAANPPSSALCSLRSLL